MTEFVVSELIRRRREMASELIATMVHTWITSATQLRLFAPGIELNAILALQSRSKPDCALRGEVVGIVFAVLRYAPEPMPTRDLVPAANRGCGIRKKSLSYRSRGCVSASTGKGRAARCKVLGSMERLAGRFVRTTHNVWLERGSIPSLGTKAGKRR